MTHGAPPRLVIGIGNPDRGDDAVGRAVARWLRDVLPPDVPVVEHDGEVAALLTRLEGAGSVWLVDASMSEAVVGTIRRFDIADAPLPQDAFGLSTHGLGLAEALELARALGQLPAGCIVYAVEVASFGAGEPLSPPVAAAVPEAGRRIQAEVMNATVAGHRADT